jgi:hypothetical protein
MDEENLRSMCAKMQQLQDVKAALEEKLKDINADLDELRLRKIPEEMETMGIRSATFTGIGRVQLAADVYASTREGQKERAIQWLRDLGYDDMIQETYNASSIKALFRRQLAEGIEPPSDIFNVQPFTRASIVKT